jgi:hypothetical protein
MHVRCFAHVLNLVFKAILSEFNKQKASSNDDNSDDDDDIDDVVDDDDVEEAEDDGDEVDPVVEASDAAMIMEVIEELEGMEVDDEEQFSERRRLTDEELNLGWFALSKVRLSCLRCFYLSKQLTAQKPCQTSLSQRNSTCRPQDCL